MDENNIEFVKGKKILSESHKAKIIKSLKPGAWNKGLKMKRDFRINSIVQNHRFATFEFISNFENLEKVLLLHKLLNTPTSRGYITKEWYIAYMDRFYNCEKFNKIYDRWLISNFDAKLKPSLDHKTPLSKGGTWELNNLDMKTWFENRVKSDMTEQEWLSIKNNVCLYFS